MYVVGLILSINSIFDPLHDSELFDDSHFWNMPSSGISEDNKPEDGGNELSFERLEANESTSGINRVESIWISNGINVSKIYPE